MIRFFCFLNAISCCWMAGSLDAQLNTYQHPSGLAFDYPPGWQAQANGERIMLTPAGAAKDAAGQPLEVSWLAGEDAEGITSPQDERVASYLEGQLRQMLPRAARQPGSRTVQTGLGEAVVLPFADTSGGLAVEAYVVLNEGTAVILLHAARKDLLTKRQAEMTGIFASLRQGPPPSTNAAGMAGVWRRSQYVRTAPGGGGGSISSTTWFYFQFAEDGSFAFAERDRISGNTADLGVILSRNGGAQVRRGRWSAADAMLRLNWADGTVENFPYTVGPTTLRLSLGGGRRAWVFDRIH